MPETISATASLLQLANGDVIKEEQGLSARSQDVVHAHGNQVDAHGVVLAGHLRQLNLGANAIGAGNKDGVGHVLGNVDGEQAAETADVAANFVAVGTMNRILDGVNGTSTLGRVYAGFGIGGCALGSPAGPLGFLVIQSVDLNAISHSISWNSNPLFGGLQTCFKPWVSAPWRTCPLNRARPSLPEGSSSPSWYQEYPPGSRR